MAKKAKYGYVTSYCKHPDGTITKWDEKKFLKNSDGTWKLLETKQFATDEEINRSAEIMVARIAKAFAEIDMRKAAERAMDA